MKKITLITLLLTVSFFASAQDNVFNFASDSEGWAANPDNGMEHDPFDTGSITWVAGNSGFARIQNMDYTFNTDNVWLHIRIKNESANHDKITINSPNGGGLAHLTISTSDTEFKEYSIELSAWEGGVGSRMYPRASSDNRSIPGDSMIIDYIIYSANATLGVEDIDFKDDASIAVYPNPVNNVLNINGKNKIESIEVINVLGQTTMVQEGASKTLDTSSLNKGVYILKIYQENNIISTKRFVKQ